MNTNGVARISLPDPSSTPHRYTVESASITATFSLLRVTTSSGSTYASGEQVTAGSGWTTSLSASHWSVSSSRKTESAVASSECAPLHCPESQAARNAPKESEKRSGQTLSDRKLI